MAIAEQAKLLRQRMGCGLLEAKRALAACSGDLLLATGWLRFDGCAINVHPKQGQSRTAAYDEWVMTKAREWVSKQIQ